MTAENMLITETLIVQPKKQSKLVKSAVKVFGYLRVKAMDFRRISLYPPANPMKKTLKIKDIQVVQNINIFKTIIFTNISLVFYSSVIIIFLFSPAYV